MGDEEVSEERTQTGDRGLDYKIQSENTGLQEVFSKRFALGSWSVIMECHPSIPSYRDLIKTCQQMQTGINLAHTFDSARQERVRTRSCLALRSFISLFMPYL